jgi:magnesium transporter
MLHTFPKSSGKTPDKGCTWIDLCDPTPEEMDSIREKFGLEVPGKRAISRIERSSRLAAHGDRLEMNAPLISGTDTDHWEMAPVGFVLTPDVLLTIRFAELESFKAVHDALKDEGEHSAAGIFTRLLEAIVDRTADHLERASAKINETTQAVFFDEPRDGRLNHDTAKLRNVMRKIGQVSDRTSRVRYTFLSIGRIADFAIDRCTPKLADDIRERLGALRRDIETLDEFETSLSDRIQLLQDAATGFISIEQNDVVKVLTVASVVGVPPVLVVGVYGMNFHDMPELSWKFGYPYALILCLLSIIVPLIWFKWRDWI